MKSKIKKYGCFWVVLMPGHPVFGWYYDRVHNTWKEALSYFLLKEL